MLSRVAIRRIAERVCLWEFTCVLLAGWACGSASAGGELPLGWYADPFPVEGRTHTFASVETPDGPALCFCTDRGKLYCWDGLKLVEHSVFPSLEYTLLIDWINDGSGGAFYIGTISKLIRFVPGAAPSILLLSGVSNVEWFDSGTGLTPHLAGFSGVHRLQNGQLTRIANWASGCMPTPLRVFDDGSGPALYASGGRNLVPPGQEGIRINGLARYRQGAWEPVGTGFAGESDCTQAMAHTMCLFAEEKGTMMAVAGDFDSVSGVPAGNLAFYRDGQWLDAGLVSRQYSTLSIIEWDGGEKLVAGGQFPLADGSDFVGFMMYDGTAWTPFGGMPVFDDYGAIFSPVVFQSPLGRHAYVWGIDIVAGSTSARWVARYGPICPDLDGSGTVDLADLAVVLADFGGETDSADSDNDGDMDLHDLALLLAGFGQSCTR